MIENFSNREIGIDAACWTAAQDQAGRLLIGSDGLTVYDGNEWRTFPIPGGYCLRAISTDGTGRIWVGASHEIGYFLPDRAGGYSYCSLLSKLPEGTGPISDVWNVFSDEDGIVFVAEDRILLWNGKKFTIFDLPGSRRLWAARSARGVFIHHPPTGLYELSDGKLRLVISASALPKAGIAWIEQNPDGSMLLAASNGFFTYRNGELNPVAPEASAYISENHLTAVVRLPDRTLAVATINGGIAFISDSGRIIRILSKQDGLPSRAVTGLFRDSQGAIWAALGGGMSRIDWNGGATFFTAGDGLPTELCLSLLGRGSDLIVCTDDGLFRLKSPESPAARFYVDQKNRNRYYMLREVNGRLLGGAAREIDDLTDGQPVPVFRAATDFFAIAGAVGQPGKFWDADGRNIREISLPAGGESVDRVLAVLPDAAGSLCVDPAGVVWAGTHTSGLFRLSPVSADRTVVEHESILPGRAANSGPATVVAVGPAVLAFVADHGFVLHPDAAGFEPIAALPPVTVRAVAELSRGGNVYVAFERSRPDGVIQEGLGMLTRLESAHPAWLELDLPGIALVGRIRALGVSAAADRPILWIGGTEGVLRVEPDRISEVGAPPKPAISCLWPMSLNEPGAADQGRWSFPYSHRKFAVHFSALDFRHRAQLLYQTRVLGESDEWSVPSARAVREISYLREGDYELQMRTVGNTGLVSEPLGVSFRILPPWFRTPGSYAAYACLIIGVVAGLVRWRQRSVLARNRELEALVRQRTAELERSSAAKDEFVASISHEIRNPLNGVIGLATALGDTELDPGQRRQLGMMRQCADHLSSLIEEILDFAKIEAGEISIDPKAFEVQELLESVRSVMHEKSAAVRIPIDLALDGSVPRVLVGDKRRIRQILLNYVGNALNYAGRGRVTMSARAVPLEGSSFEITFSVADEGPGIPSSEQATLFGKFKRGIVARKRNVRGAGLGLAVSRSLAERMGGSVMMQSEVGCGAIFHLRLPLARHDAAAASAGGPPVPITLPGPALVVDDMEFNAAGLVAMLRHIGIGAETAASGEEALEKCAAKPYFMIFVDCDLPGISGLEFARALRRREDQRRSVLIATTAYATRQVVDECLAAGMDGFLGKPITIEKLRKAIAERLTAGRTAASVHFAGADNLAEHPFRLDALRYIANDDSEELSRRLRSYVRELDAYAEELRVTAQVVDFSKMRRVAHKMVAHLSLVQHAGLLDIAQQLEESAVNRDIAGASAQLTELNSGLRGLRPQLLAAAENTRDG